MLEKYKAIAEKENFNISKGSPWLVFLNYLAAVFVLGGILMASFHLGALALVQFIDLEKEAEIFSGVDFVSAFAGEEGGLKTDQAETQKVQTLLEDLSGTDFFQVTVVESDLVNAVAAPGGKIYIFSGLLEELESKEEVAFVLAHELSHVKNRDSLKAMARVIPFQILASFFDDQGGLGPGNLGRLAEISFSRKIELRADREALETLEATYGRVKGAKDFFRKVKENEELVKDSWNWDFYSDHPDYNQRMKQIEMFEDS
jgi:Zn-dependent protease with chaperone function